jgi:hypothetical protein
MYAIMVVCVRKKRCRAATLLSEHDVEGARVERNLEFLLVGSFG